MTVSADKIDPNISYDGLLLTIFIDKDEKVASSKKHPNSRLES